MAKSSEHQAEQAKSERAPARRATVSANDFPKLAQKLVAQIAWLTESVKALEADARLRNGNKAILSKEPEWP